MLRSEGGEGFSQQQPLQAAALAPHVWQSTPYGGNVLRKVRQNYGKPAFTAGSHRKSSQSRQEPLDSPKARNSPLPHEGTPTARVPQHAPPPAQPSAAAGGAAAGARLPAPQVPAARVPPLTSVPRGGAAKLGARWRFPPGRGRRGSAPPGG